MESLKVAIILGSRSATSNLSLGRSPAISPHYRSLAACQWRLRYLSDSSAYKGGQWIRNSIRGINTTATHTMVRVVMSLALTQDMNVRMRHSITAVQLIRRVLQRNRFLHIRSCRKYPGLGDRSLRKSPQARTNNVIRESAFLIGRTWCVADLANSR